MTLQDRRGAAYHEAGHAVVAAALGLTVGLIEIAIDGDDARGAADIQDNPNLPLQDQLAVCAAGMEAQKLFKAPTHDGAGWGDFGKMIELLKDKAEEESFLLRQAGHQRAHELLTQHLEIVHKVATAAIAARKLSADEVRLLLEPLVH